MPSGSGEASRPPTVVTRMGGVRADFVANLGRRLAELRQCWAELEQEPASPRLRDEVRRRIHALATRARLLEFGAMADRLDDAERRLDSAAAAGVVDGEDVAWFHELLRTLPALAWNDVSSDAQDLAIPDYQNVGSRPAPSRRLAQFPLAILIVGAEPFALALATGDAAMDIEAERTDDLRVAQDLARALAPDVIVLDADLDDAQSLVAALADDPLTEPVPIVAVGSWTNPDHASTLLSLGVTRTLPKPASPDRLRNAVLDVAGQHREVPELEGLGEISLYELADRLSDQVKSGLLDAAKPESRAVRVSLGEGTEVLAALWGAVARIRETLTIRSQGAIRFSALGPVGAVPIAPWLDMTASSDQPRRGETDEEAKRIRLDGRRILVADDDPAVTWFLSGLFRSAGATVVEAHDGRKALDAAYRFSPELVVSDILMPGLDGFSLCREIKRDVALHDVPVVLLSWKEDLLQRVRELGASADGYLKKESSGPAILRRVAELLRPRIRVESRLRAGGEVCGRLDGLTARSLLLLVATSMPDARVSVRDAHYLYEVEVRDGSPRTATRTAQDGSFIRGPHVLVALLGVFSGRFHVTSSTAQVRDSFQGDLLSLLNPPIARARAAVRLLTGKRLADVARVQLNVEALALHVSPPEIRLVAQALAAGANPHEMIVEGQTSLATLDRLLTDAASRGAIEAVINAQGRDLLEVETRGVLDQMRVEYPSRRPPRVVPQPPPLPSPEPSPVEEQAANVDEEVTKTEPAEEDELMGFARSTEDEAPPPTTRLAPVSASSSSLAHTAASAPRSGLTFLAPAPVAVEEAPKPQHETPVTVGSGGPPTSLAEAVIREILDQEGVRIASPPPPPMLDARELRPRSLLPVARPVPSLPPDVIVPAGATHDVSGAPPELSVPATPSIPPAPKTPRMEPPPEIEVSGPHSWVPDSDVERLLDPSNADPVFDLERPSRSPQKRTLPSPREREPVEQPPQTEAPTGGMAGNALAAVLSLLVGAAMIAGGIAARPAIVAVPSGSTPVASTPSAPAASITAPARPAPEVSSQPSATASPSASTATEEEGEDGEDLPLPVGSTLPRGTGMLEVRTSLSDCVVIVDGMEVGGGPVTHAVLRPGKHNIVLRWRGKDQRGTAVVKAGRKVVWTLEPAWNP